LKGKEKKKSLLVSLLMSLLQMSRIVANKAALSIRVDALGDSETPQIGEDNLAICERKLQQLEGREITRSVKVPPKGASRYDHTRSSEDPTKMKDVESYNEKNDAILGSKRPRPEVSTDDEPKKKKPKKAKRRDEDDDDEDDKKSNGSAVEEEKKKKKKAKKESTKEEDSDDDDAAEEKKKKKKKNKDKKDKKKKKNKD